MKCVHPKCPGKNPKILGRGLCVTCYSRERKNGFKGWPKTKQRRNTGKRKVVPFVPRTEVVLVPEALTPIPNDLKGVLVEIAATCTRISEISLEMAREFK